MRHFSNKNPSRGALVGRQRQTSRAYCCGWVELAFGEDNARRVLDFCMRKVILLAKLLLSGRCQPEFLLAVGDEARPGAEVRIKPCAVSNAADLGVIVT